MKVAYRYFLYSVGFFITIFIVLQLQQLLKQHTAETYNFIPMIIYAPLLYIIIGIILGLPTILKENSKSGRWAFKLEKLVFVGVPALYIALYPLIYAKARILMLPNYISTVLLSSEIYLVAALIFGYILITVLEKKNIEHPGVQTNV
ncbi:hypothetical protein [Bacillus sp. AFS029533]|uniref:hypothetical protein n=1 Tax=Bacillus sp. AFS029533 TaxID=2033494 RepID=UPI000BFD6CB8|nr:hypothetical protein [Bacillus sp. AFS029533]PGZ90926.1 hypothetical protein COE53_16445 [Bacillus sp. AFS029533]